MERERIWSWYGISLVLNVHESTVKRWSRDDASFRRLVKRYGRRVFAYRDDLENWRRSVERSLGEAPRQALLSGGLANG